MENYNFDTTIVEAIDLPYGEKPYIRVRMADQKLEGYEVLVIEDSIPVGGGNRLTTVVARFPRCILSEVNTHRVFSRNSASSRARSVKRTIADVMDNPYIPPFTRNQRGMSGRFIDGDAALRAKSIWLKSRDSAVANALRLLMGDLIAKEISDSDLAKDYEKRLDLYYEKVYSSEEQIAGVPSVHKQDVNRILEPYMWHEAVITSSFWENFIELRADLRFAQPAIVALGAMVKDALNSSEPQERLAHLPFLNEELREKIKVGSSLADLREISMISASHAAQISYYDKSNGEKATASSTLGERLLQAKHMSPFEHVAYTKELFNLGDLKEHHGNLHSDWVQFRKVVAKDYPR